MPTAQPSDNLQSIAVLRSRLPLSTSMAKYIAQLKRISGLTEKERHSLARLYLSYYSGTSEERFFADLNGKTEILLVSCDDALVGFTTFQLYAREWDGNLIRIVYSGDTVVEQAHWGQQTLAFSWIARMGEIKRERPEVPLYWLLIVKGHRTFKYLPTFGRSFYPHWSIDRSDLKPLTDFLAQEKFGAYFNPATSSHGHCMAYRRAGIPACRKVLS
jgi:hypothetical protein